MDRLSSIPVELILEIFSSVRQFKDDIPRSDAHRYSPEVGNFDTTRNWKSQSTFASLCRVSRSLGGIAEGFLYQQIHVVVGNRPQLQFCKLLQTLARRPDLGSLVRSLKLTYDWDPSDYRNPLADVALLKKLARESPYTGGPAEGWLMDKYQSKTIMLILLLERIPNVETISHSVDKPRMEQQDDLPWKPVPIRPRPSLPPLRKLKSFKVYPGPKGDLVGYCMLDVRDLWKLLPMNLDTVALQRWSVAEPFDFFSNVRDLSLNSCRLGCASFRLILRSCKDLRRLSLTQGELSWWCGRSGQVSEDDVLSPKKCFDALKQYSAATLTELELEVVDTGCYWNSPNVYTGGHHGSSYEFTKLETLTLSCQSHDTDLKAPISGPREVVIETLPKSLKHLAIKNWLPSSSVMFKMQDVAWLVDAATEGRLPNLKALELELLTPFEGPHQRTEVERQVELLSRQFSNYTLPIKVSRRLGWPLW